MVERLVGVEIHDVLGIRDLEIRPGVITVVEGPNGSGKTSVLTAIQAALGGGTSLAKLVRIAAKDDVGDEPLVEPEVVLVLEDETGTATRVRQDIDGVDVRSQVPGTKGFKEMASPRSVLKALWDGQGANPVRFASELTAEKDRTKMLLESLDLTFDLDSFKAEVRVPASVNLPSQSLFTSPLETVALVRESVYMTRRGCNVDAKAKTSAAEETRLKVPQEWEDDLDPAQVARDEARVTALVRQIGSAEEAAAGERRAALKAAEDAYATAEKGASDSLRAATSDLMAQLERDMAKLRADYDATVAGMKEADGVHLAQAAQLRDNRKAEAQTAHDTALGRVQEAREELTQARLAVAGHKSKAEAAAGWRALTEQAATFDAEAERLQGESEGLTACLDRIDAYRAEMAKQIPIKGLEIRDGVVCIDRDGVVLPVSSMSHGERLMVGIDVAALRVKGLPLILVDEAESLDEEHLGIFFQGIRDRGLQAIVGKVSNGKQLKTWSER